jgi:hypothetical protein
MTMVAYITGLVLILKANFMPQATVMGRTKGENLRKRVERLPVQKEGIQGQCQWRKLRQWHLHGLWQGLKNLLVRK